ncbi:hypothetical protein JWZ98_11275 [Methylomonas sp. EFPC1]|uniref:hypothetical protein n=1 Tax=Methylomonas sp. EFPC1 TaxID=2812647 RepID=UPI0019672EA8|nr:hypothetical protein [Methylomonas sp. EFPC1]QSB03458.1 hypothetical protein JWZ98_11275 [Methylomonas sp. EFPC1]
MGNAERQAWDFNTIKEFDDDGGVSGYGRGPVIIGGIRFFCTGSSLLAHGTRNNYISAGDFYQTSLGEVVLDTGSVLAAGMSLAGAAGSKIDNVNLKWYEDSASTVEVVNSGGSGATINLTYNLAAARAALGGAPSLLVPVYVYDYTLINSIIIRLSMGDATFANNYSYSYGVSNVGGLNLKKNGWHLISVGSSDWVGAGTVDWGNQTINAVRISFLNASGANNAKIAIDKVRINNRAKAKILLMTDGTYTEQWDVNRKLLNALNLRATFSVTEGEQNVPGRMTSNQIFQLADEGNAFVPRNTIGFNSMNADQCIANAKKAQDFIKSFLGSIGEMGSKFFTFNQGQYFAAGGITGDMTVVNRMSSELGIVGARTTEATNSPGYMILGAGAYPPNIMVAPIIGNWAGNTIAALRSNIDTAIDRGAAIVYFNHRAQNIAGSIESTELVRSIYEYVALKKSQGLIDDVTWPEFYYGA